MSEEVTKDANDVQSLVVALSKATTEGVDLRYQADGRWSVLVPLGNVMVVVPGSVSGDPIQSLTHCLKRWEGRTPEQPFI